MVSKSERVPVVFVEKRNAKFVKESLGKVGCLSKDFRMIPTAEGRIAIPVNMNSYEEQNTDAEWSAKVVGIGEHECPYSTAKLGNNRLSVDSDLTCVQQALCNWLGGGGSIKKSVMSLDIKVCPKKLEYFGDDRSLIVPRKAFSLESESFGALVGDDADLNGLWQHLAKVHNSPRVAKRGDIDPESPIRESGHVLLWPATIDEAQTTPCDTATYGPGSPGWITVTEQGIRQSLDMTRVMFSRGNITEKIRFARIVQEGDIILDMYAGIGYYTLPALVLGKAAYVCACEWNKHAAFALKYNLRANGVNDRAVVHVGDCRTAAKEHSLVDRFDRVSLGLLPSSEGGWRTSVKALKRSSGGWLHVHGNVPEIECKQWTLWLCRCLATLSHEEVSNDWIAICTNVERVKSFAPTIYHYVADIFVGPKEQLGERSINVCLHGASAGMMIVNTKEFKPSPDPAEKPSCALDPDGILSQEWMMEQQTA